MTCPSDAQKHERPPGSDRRAKLKYRESNHTTNPRPIQSGDPFELILSHAEGVKRLGTDKAIFKAPTRKDKTASVSIARGANGSVIIHDFGGDSTADILAAMGLSLASLYPEQLRANMTAAQKSELRMHGKIAGWTAALSVISYESKIIVIAGRMFKKGEALDAADENRVDEALGRIESAREVLRG